MDCGVSILRLECDAEVGLEGLAPRFLRGQFRAADFDAALDSLDVVLAKHDMTVVLGEDAEACGRNASRRWRGGGAFSPPARNRRTVRVEGNRTPGRYASLGRCSSRGLCRARSRGPRRILANRTRGRRLGSTRRRGSAASALAAAAELPRCRRRLLLSQRCARASGRARSVPRDQNLRGRSPQKARDCMIRQA